MEEEVSWIPLIPLHFLKETLEKWCMYTILEQFKYLILYTSIVHGAQDKLEKATFR